MMSRQVWGLLRLEGLVFLSLGLFVYWHLGGGWLFFLLCFLVPDLSIMAYLSENKVMASSVYNALHTYLVPGILALVGIFMEGQFVLLLASVWTAHIGIDRALGFGLKLPTGFKDTHLGFPYHTLASHLQDVGTES